MFKDFHFEMLEKMSHVDFYIFTGRGSDPGQQEAVVGNSQRRGD